jgi:hypothetical protein
MVSSVDRHSETFYQPLSRPPARAVADKMNKFSDSLGLTSVRTNTLRQLIRKCPTLTLAVQTSPTARLHLHHHGGALRRQVLKLSEISAVPTCRRLAAPRTGAYFRSHRRDHPMIAVPLDRKNSRARPGSPIHVFSHARLSARRPIKPTSTESEADPNNSPSPIRARPGCATQTSFAAASATVSARLKQGPYSVQIWGPGSVLIDRMSQVGGFLPSNGASGNGRTLHRSRPMPTSLTAASPRRSRASRA